MDTLHLRVSAPFGATQVISGVPIVEHSEVFTLVEGVVNDPYEPESGGGDTVDDLIDAFQAEHRCKVSYLGTVSGQERLFEIFEPTYTTSDAAHNVADLLLDRLADYVQGRPQAK